MDRPIPTDICLNFHIWNETIEATGRKGGEARLYFTGTRAFSIYHSAREANSL